MNVATCRLLGIAIGDVLPEVLFSSQRGRYAINLLRVVRAGTRRNTKTCMEDRVKCASELSRCIDKISFAAQCLISAMIPAAYNNCMHSDLVSQKVYRR